MRVNHLEKRHSASAGKRLTSYHFLIALLTLGLGLGGGLYSTHLSASCEANALAITLAGARDEPQMVQTVKQCATQEQSSDADVASLLGYIYRHGYGVPRNINAARRFYTDAIADGVCEPYAVCGLKELASRAAPHGCEVDCIQLAEQGQIEDQDDTAQDAKARAYDLLAELLNSDPTIRRTATDLQNALNDILTQEEQLRNEAYQQLCTGHVKRAVVTISVAHQLGREMKRRERLVKHHTSKVEKDGNAQSQAALLQLSEAQNRSSQDKRVFFEKYAKSVFSASNCDVGILSSSYAVFEREIAEVSVTALEQSAYRLFKEHVEDARADRGMNSTWFNNLDQLLDQE